MVFKSTFGTRGFKVHFLIVYFVKVHVLKYMFYCFKVRVSRPHTFAQFLLYVAMHIFYFDNRLIGLKVMPK